MKNWLKQVAVCGVAGLMAAGCGTTWAVMRVEELDRRVKEELTPGMDHAQVAAFLDAGKIPHSRDLQPENKMYVKVQEPRSGSSPGRDVEYQFWFNGRGQFVTTTPRELVDHERYCLWTWCWGRR